MLGSEKRSFLTAQPPPNYVAGLGRGATGFTTRSDIGPARDGPDPIVPAVQPQKDDDDDRGDYSESNFDEFSGYSAPLFDSTTPYDQEDKEADAVWEAIDSRMDSRRRTRRETRMKQDLQKYRATRPKIQQQLSDLKRELGTLTEADWDAIPDSTNQARPRKRRMVPEFQRYTPVPDSIIEHARTENMPIPILSGISTPGVNTPAGTSVPGTTTDLREIGITRSKLLEMKLSGISTAVAGQSAVDSKGYLTDLNSLKGISDAEIGDIKRARMLLKNVRTTNPHHPPGWIASARLEEVAGRLLQARKIIMRGTEMCKEAEDVWLEAARLQTKENARGILAQAVQNIPKSVKVWIAAADLEDDVNAKRRILRKALEFVPNSVRLWKAAVQLEDPENARVLLSRAVECVPQSVDVWLALARLESHENARKVLNKAREILPTEPLIWITAAKLEEAHGLESTVTTIIKRGVKSLRVHNVSMSREDWLKEAQTAEKAGSVATCQAIIAETIGMDVEEADRKKTWKEDAENAIGAGNPVTARAIYANALTVFPGKKSLWLGAAMLEKQYGTRDGLDALLKKAVSYCPQAEVLWLMAAKEKWLGGDVPAARCILQEAFAANPDSEAIWLAAVKLENENNQQERARSLLNRARITCPTEHVWIKSAQLEKQLNNRDAEKSLLEDALKLYPQSAKLWIMRGSLAFDTEGVNSARELYETGLRHCPTSVKLWLSAARCEESVGTSVAQGKARALLEKARHAIPKCADLWLEVIRVENRAGNKKVAQGLMAKALQECPRSGILWAELIENEPPQGKKARSVDALKHCDDDAHVIVSIAKCVIHLQFYGSTSLSPNHQITRIFWADRKVEKARTWFNRAVTLNPDLGDAWANFYKFETQHGTAKTQEDVKQRCAQAEPRHGEKWAAVAKNPTNKRLAFRDLLLKVALTL